MAEELIELTITSDVGGEGRPAVLSIVITGSECRLEDLQMVLVAEIAKWRRESPKARSTKPCGCKGAS